MIGKSVFACNVSFSYVGTNRYNPLIELMIEFKVNVLTIYVLSKVLFDGINLFC